MSEENSINKAFERSKIYEKLDYKPEPENYKGKIPWIVQQQIAATNGIHYFDRIGKLKDYPIYNLPLPEIKEGLMLDIGCGWGRWLLAGENKGYIPVGMDIRHEFCKTALQTLHNHNKQGYAVVADLKNLPFKDNIFDLVWSFSVIQHTHFERLTACLHHISRILHPTGFTFLEFPNKNGIRNRFTHVISEQANAGNYNSWAVRYYSIREYRNLFMKYFGNFDFSNHSFLGIGILPEDLKYVSLKNKMICSVSLAGSYLANLIPGLKYFSDSIYIKSFKPQNGSSIKAQEDVKNFLKAHELNPMDNLNIRFLLRCPKTGFELELNEEKTRLKVQNTSLSYPIIDNIPILHESEIIS